MAPNIIVESFEFSDSPNPGDLVELSISFENIGNQELEECYIDIEINNSLINLSQSQSYIGTISPGQVATNSEPLIIEFSEDIIDGSIVTFNLNINNT